MKKVLIAITFCLFIVNATESKIVQEADLKMKNREYIEAAFTLYKKACLDEKRSCDLELGFACFAVGYKYKSGDGVKKSNEKMNGFYQKACELKNPQGCFNLGASYIFGWGYEKNIQKAKEFYGKACELKMEEGCKKYAELYDYSSNQ